MSNPQKKKDSQVSLILRTAGGAYLLYLAWDLREAVFGGQPLYSIPIVIFAAVGAALVAFSIVPLIKGDYVRPGEDAQETQEAQAPDAPAAPDTLLQNADEDVSDEDL